jgi:membrane protease YdiL (CAAX protease family)
MTLVERPAAGVREPLLAFCAATALAAGLSLASGAVPFLRDNLHVPIAIIFFYTPAIAARIGGRTFDYREAGLRLDPVGLNAGVVGAAVAVAFPLFIAGFFLFYGALCGPHGTQVLPHVASMFGRLCRHWLGWSGGRLRLPDHFVLSALNQLVVVAIPEELFFRGYLMPGLERRWKPTRTLLGARVGLALVVSSVLFALGHILVVPNPQRLAVFFPALLFGWMRARTGSIAAGACFHALCNLFADVLHTSYFY